MKKILFIVFAICILVPRVKAQNKDAAAIGAAAILVGTGILFAEEIHKYREAFERDIVEWIMENKNFENKVEFDLDLIKWEVTKKEDFNSVSIMGFKFIENNNEKKVLLSVCSPGWVNQYGIDFHKVSIIEIDKNRWNVILKAFLNLSRRNDIKTPVSLESIPVESSSLLSKKVKTSNENIQNLEMIDEKSLGFTSGKYKFEPIGGNTHIVQDLDQDFMLDYNEGSINLFLKRTKELIKLKRSFIIDVNKIFYN